jgi:DNA-binding MarR family transcriptional regulator
MDSDHDIRDHLVFRMSLFATITDRSGKNSFSAAFGLSLREYRILAVIAYMQPVSLTALVTECCLDKGQVSRNVTKLVDAGYLTRTGGKPDRGGLLELTQAGTDLYRRALAYGDLLNDVIAASLTEEERRTVSVAMNKLLAAARALKEDPPPRI